MSLPIATSGAPLGEAKAAMILIHGRGASAQSILSLADELPAEGLAYLAPQAAGSVWYPQRFLAPLAANEPHLSNALAAIGDLVRQLGQAGIPAERTYLLGFSQGACLALEYAARKPQRYGGVFGLSGGLIGPEVQAERYSGSLQGTPVLLGCSDVDFHIPLERVHESRDVLAALGGAVEERIYPGMGHTVNLDEVAFIRQVILQGAQH